MRSEDLNKHRNDVFRLVSVMAVDAKFDFEESLQLMEGLFE